MSIKTCMTCTKLLDFDEWNCQKPHNAFSSVRKCTTKKQAESLGPDCLLAPLLGFVNESCAPEGS